MEGKWATWPKISFTYPNLWQYICNKNIWECLLLILGGSLGRGQRSFPNRFKNVQIRPISIQGGWLAWCFVVLRGGLRVPLQGPELAWFDSSPTPKLGEPELPLSEPLDEKRRKDEERWLESSQLPVVKIGDNSSLYFIANVWLMTEMCILHSFSFELA